MLTFFKSGHHLMANYPFVSLEGNIVAHSALILIVNPSKKQLPNTPLENEHESWDEKFDTPNKTIAQLDTSEKIKDNWDDDSSDDGLEINHSYQHGLLQKRNSQAPPNSPAVHINNGTKLGLSRTLHRQAGHGHDTIHEVLKLIQ